MDTKVVSEEQKAPEHNRAKVWQLFLFSFNNISTNMPYVVISSYFLFYAQNFLALSAVLIGWIITSMRLFDGITDPIVGFLIDRTDTKFGKFRPWMIVGNIIINVSFFLMFTLDPSMDGGPKLAMLIFFYTIFILGYSMQTASTKGGGAIITSDPKQRPTLALFNGTVGTIVLTLFMSYIPISAKNYADNMLDADFWYDTALIACVASVLFMILAVIGIWGKDKPENYLGFTGAKVKFKDFWPVLRDNRAIQMLVIAAATDKLAFSTVASVTVYFFANIMLDQDMAGIFGLITLPVAFAGMFFGTYLGRRFSQKKAFLFATWVALFSSIVCLVTFPDVGASLASFSVIIFFVSMLVQKGFASVTGAFVITMIADCSDYETYLSGRSVPGMMGTLFSFVDKLVSSLNGLIIAGLFSAFGLANVTIVPLEEATSYDGLYAVIVIGLFVLPILGYIASVIAMRFYPLDKDKMAEVSETISLYKQNQHDPRSEAYVAEEE